MIAIATRILVIIFFVCLLEISVRIGFINKLLFPPPTEILITFKKLVFNVKFLKHLGITSIEIFLASLISIPTGILAGLMLAKHLFVGKFFGSFVYFLVSVPKSIFLPIFILILGVDLEQKVAFGVAQAFFVIAINTAAATTNVPVAWVNLAVAFGASTWQLYTRIYIPAMIPMILEGVRLGVIFIITGVILAEMYASRSGLGYAISSYADTFDMPFLFAGIMVATILSIFINETIRFYEKKISKWRV